MRDRVTSDGSLLDESRSLTYAGRVDQREARELLEVEIGKLRTRSYSELVALTRSGPPYVAGAALRLTRKP
jgi:hypothetical protein